MYQDELPNSHTIGYCIDNSRAITLDRLQVLETLHEGIDLLRFQTAPPAHGQCCSPLLGLKSRAGIAGSGCYCLDSVMEQEMATDTHKNAEHTFNPDQHTQAAQEQAVNAAPHVSKSLRTFLRISLVDDFSTDVDGKMAAFLPA